MWIVTFNILGRFANSLALRQILLYSTCKTEILKIESLLISNKVLNVPTHYQLYVVYDVDETGVPSENHRLTISHW